jgi:pimeloyl-ACP methyl ester carboxylesterase
VTGSGAAEPVFSQVPVAGGELAVARWGAGPRVVLGLHGITGSSMQLAAIADLLGADFTLLAPDLRGRGGSASLPGPFGMQVHADDCAAVLASFGAADVVVLGESMGAFVAVVLAATRPDLISRLVLADGGIPIPLPAGVDPDSVLEAVVGPAMARLGQVFATRHDYLDFWRAHPAVSEDWNDYVEVYLDYDLEPVSGGFRSKASEEAVRGDGEDTLGRPELVATSLRSLTCPVALIRAPRNLTNQPLPLIPDTIVAEVRAYLPQLTDIMVPDTNHYTLFFGDRGARVIAGYVRGM